jgi:hypothetical protein
LTDLSDWPYTLLPFAKFSNVPMADRILRQVRLANHVMGHSKQSSEMCFTAPDSAPGLSAEQNTAGPGQKHVISFVFNDLQAFPGAGAASGTAHAIAPPSAT